MGESGLRVLHVAQPTTGGVAAYVRDACAHQQRRGWLVAAACPADGMLPVALDRLGVPWFGWTARRSPGASTVAEGLRLRAIIRSFRPDVVHLHSSKAGLAGRLGRPAGGAPVVFQPHGWSWLAAGGGGMRRASRLWERSAARRTDLLVCVGGGEAAEGMAAGIEAPYLVVRNGVDLDRHRPAGTAARLAARDRLGLPPAAPVAVCVGRVTPQKGQDVLLRAWPGVRARCPLARLLVVGDGERLERWRPLGGPGVHFVGAVADPRPWYAAADVVALPSRWEGLPLTVLEALAAGRPVVASDIPGLAEVVAPEAGALVPPGSPEPLGEALAVRLADPAVAAAEGKAAAEHARAFSAARTFERLAAATEELADSRCKVL